MADISKCKWENCSIKERCKRYTVLSSEYQLRDQWQEKDWECDWLYINK